MKVIGLGLLALVCMSVACGSPTPTPPPVVCESDSSTFEKKGDVHDDYQVICVENGGYYLHLTLNNDTDEPFRINLLQEDKGPHKLYEVRRKALDDAAVELFTVCWSDCDVTPGRVRMEVDAPDAPANVEWAIRVEKKPDPA